MEKFLVIGGDSLIGSSLCAYLRQLNKCVTTTTRRREYMHQNQIYLDLLSFEQSMFDHYGQAFLCAGITNILACESNPDATYKINVDATVSVAKQLLQTGCRVVFISSNTVFDGQIKYPNEDVAYHYTTEYGRQKSETEKQLLALGAGIIIIRITKVISLSNAFFLSLIEKLKSGLHCEVFSDLLISPISIQYLCESIIKIMDSGQEGIFHLSGKKDFSYATFASHVAKHIGADRSLIQPMPAKTVPFKPKYAGLGMKRTMSLLNISPESIDSVLTNLMTTR